MIRRSQTKARGNRLRRQLGNCNSRAASITTPGATFAAATPVALFTTPFALGGGSNKQQYAVSRDGRFLINQPAETSATIPITLILNWKPKP